jgi:hypothetical protein
MDLRSRPEFSIHSSAQQVWRSPFRLAQILLLLSLRVFADPNPGYLATLSLHPWGMQPSTASPLVLDPIVLAHLFFLLLHRVCLYFAPVSSCPPIASPGGIRQLVILRSRFLLACPDVSISPCLNHHRLADTCSLVLDLLLGSEKGSGCFRWNRHTY